MNRSECIDHFLGANGWQGAKRVMLAGDASFRKYERVFMGNKQAVLMDAPPDKENIRPFMKIAWYLLGNKLSAPCIIASDTENGFLLLEDLGDDLFASVLEKQPDLEQALYLVAADVLVQLYHAAAKTDYSDVPLFDMEKMLMQVALLPEWFIPLVSKQEDVNTLKKEYLDLWRKVLSALPDLRKVMVLYDFHAENLLWLPGREDAARAGLLDFQDAMRGSPAYDMVSFLEDARRDVVPETVTKVIDYYLAKTGMPKPDFMAAYAIMGAQRNCRIVGTFARLAVRDSKPRYLSFMPRVWQHVENDLSHPLLRPIKDWMDAYIKPQWRGEIRIAA